MHRAFVVLVLAALALATPAHATTWQVAQDGSGDFELVQDAVEAASSGDTIRIAAGVYPELREYTLPGGIIPMVAYVQVAELTIVGEGRDSVILGPELPGPDLERGPSGIYCSASGNVRVSGVTVRNLAAGVRGNDDWIEVEDCRFAGNYQGVATSLTGFVSVKRCEISGSEDAGVMAFATFGGTGALVEDCRFVDNQLGIDFQPSNCTVRNSEFEGGIVGVQFSFGGRGGVAEGCSFDGMLNVGLAIANGSIVTLTNSEFQPTMAGNIDVNGFLAGSGNILRGGSYTTLRITYPADVDFSGNHILNSGGYSVLAAGGASPPIQTKDFSGNYWGTTNTVQIEEWIYDSNDFPVDNYQLIEYQPLADQPITTERTSFGRWKAGQ